MDKILDGFEILKAENMGLSVNDVINILQKVDNFDTLKTIEGISEDKMKKDRQYYLDMHPYEIYFSEKEQRWRTQIADDCIHLTNTFRHDKKPAAETQVFMDEEKSLLEEVILKEITDNPEYGTTGLALILLFQTGLRSGEITNIPPRSCHKIRKTFISTLIDTNGISNDEVRRIAGHSDLAVTNSCYVFNRNPASQTLDILNDVL